MKKIAVIPIPSREWKVKKTRETLVYDDRDTARKKDQRKVDERLHYMWFQVSSIMFGFGGDKLLVFQREVVEVKSFQPTEGESIKRHIQEVGFRRRS